MNYVINKGIAGLGNRLQSLGWALDTALKHDAKLVVDWEDTTWRFPFGDYFTLDGIDIAPLSEVPDDIDVSPKAWRGLWREQAGSRKGCKAMTYRIAPGAEAQVICVYKHRHSDDLYRRIRLSGESRHFLKAARVSHGLSLGEFNVWHIRHTDKRTERWENYIKDAANEQKKTGIRSVVVTDSLQVQEVAHRLGLCCPSSICDPLPGGGVHHADINDLAKHVVNMSAIADMWLGIEAEAFTACCPDSTFSQFVERMRKVRAAQRGSSDKAKHRGAGASIPHRA